MSAADVACYAAKDQGRNRAQLYKPDNVPERHREMHWVSRLTRACDEGRFELFYQPIVPIGPRLAEPEHFELMLRLRDEGGALVAPAEFIPAAERYNVMPIHRSLGGARGARSPRAPHRPRASSRIPSPSICPAPRSTTSGSSNM